MIESDRAEEEAVGSGEPTLRLYGLSSLLWQYICPSLLLSRREEVEYIRHRSRSV